MEFEFNSNDGTGILARGETGEGVSPFFGPGNGDDAFPAPEEFSDAEDEEDVYTEDYFEYPDDISERLVQLSCDLEGLRAALAQERRCLSREGEEVAALRSLDSCGVGPEYEEETVSVYEPREAAFLQAERRRQEQALANKERYVKHMMQVEKMCTEEFSHLNETRAKVDRLNREISDWRLTNGSTTRFTPFPMEVMRAPNPPYQAGGASATMPGRFTVNQPLTCAGHKSVPNVALPVPDNNPCLFSGSFDSGRLWVPTLPGAVMHAPPCEQRRPPGSKEEGERPLTWKSGDADERAHF